MSEHHLSCRDFVSFLDDYLEGRLSAESHSVFEVHMSKCPCCEKYLACYRETVLLTKKCCEPCPEMPKQVPSELVKAILAARKADAGE